MYQSSKLARGDSPVSIIGAGNIAQAVARHAVAAGHDVVISNSRGGIVDEDAVVAMLRSGGGGEKDKGGDPARLRGSHRPVVSISWAGWRRSC